MIITGNSLEVLPKLQPDSFHTCITSPPYWGLRDYGLEASYWPQVTYTPMPGFPPITVPEWTGCLGLEPTPEMFVAHIILIFREIWRVLRKDGTVWVNFGDSYAGSGKGAWKNKKRQKEVYVIDPGATLTKMPKKPTGLKNKDLVGIPWRVAFALQADGWYLRMDNIWNKTNPMPESVRDRPTKAHEYIFLLAKSEQYYFDSEAIEELAVTQGAQNSFARAVKESPPPGNSLQHRTDRKNIEYSGKRNKRSVWTVSTANFPGAHYAVFPEELILPFILASSPVGGRVLDPFGGRGTTLKVSLENNRECTIIEMGSHNVRLAERWTAVVQPTLIFGEMEQ
ncbi:DNA methylase [Paenibacillus sp. Root52]|uniref:DNA-methyltransferase n=1 Tax=Paenibacillus sp. Root52 TaxID=1736552 RepID=UPI0006F96413|nr:site-specific DNA-methyltransferase [Paenibacillus sp. Root52]KQY83750.1 DNA methylase [Paenibacillus sp. Root52]